MIEKRSLEAKIAKLNSLMIEGIANKDSIGPNDRVRYFLLLILIGSFSFPDQPLFSSLKC